jgi:hypothetical protein
MKRRAVIALRDESTTRRRRGLPSGPVRDPAGSWSPDGPGRPPGGPAARKVSYVRRRPAGEPAGGAAISDAYDIRGNHAVGRAAANCPEMSLGAGRRGGLRQQTAQRCRSGRGQEPLVALRTTVEGKVLLLYEQCRYLQCCSGPRATTADRPTLLLAWPGSAGREDGARAGPAEGGPREGRGRGRLEAWPSGGRTGCGRADRKAAPAREQDRGPDHGAARLSRGWDR